MEGDQPATCSFRCINFFGNHYEGFLMILIPLMLLPLLFLPDHVMEYRCMYVVLVMALYWITELIPLSLTAMIPIIAFPIMNILDSKTVCECYYNNTLLLFFAGLILALVIEYSNLHRRIAYGTLLMVGCSPSKLLFGILLVTMFLSMWISNSATAAMFCPIIKVLLTELSEQGLVKMYSDNPAKEERQPKPSKVVRCYYLGVAYASTIGGCGTLIGTGTNLTFKGIYETRFPDGDHIDFLAFMLYASPIMLVQTMLLFLWMKFLYLGWLRPGSKAQKDISLGIEGESIARGVIENKYKELGSPTCQEIQVSILFFLMISLLITRQPGLFTGWADILNLKRIKGSMPLCLVVVLLFALPINYGFLRYLTCRRRYFFNIFITSFMQLQPISHYIGPAEEMPRVALMPWSFVQENLPFGLMFLLGGGFALSKGVVASGFSKMIAEGLSFLKILHPAAIQLICIISGAFLTAFSSNVAICNIIIPVLCELAIAIRIHPLYLTLPAALGCGLAFHLPVSTPPNAIVADFSGMKTKDMAIGGIGPTVFTITTLFLASQTWIFVCYPAIGDFPEWQSIEKNFSVRLNNLFGKRSLSIFNI